MTADGGLVLSGASIWLNGQGDCYHAIFDNSNHPCGDTSPTGSDASEFISYGEGLVFLPRIGGTPSYFDFSGNMVFQGNVSVGTSSRPNQFNVQNGVTIDAAGTNNGSLANNSSTGNALTFGNGSGEGIASQRTGGTGQFGLDFYTDFLQRMTIAQYGWVGIGTNNPQATLDINGNLAVRSGGIIFPDNTVQQTASNLQGITSSGGKIGIGTTNPTQSLTIAGPTVGLDNSAALQWKDNSGNYRNMLGLDVNNDFQFGQANSFQFHAPFGVAAPQPAQDIRIGLDVVQPNQSLALVLQSDGNFNFRGNGDLILNNMSQHGEMHIAGGAYGAPAGQLEVDVWSPGQRGLVLNGAVGQSSDYVNINSNGNSGGNLFKIDSSGNVTSNGNISAGNLNVSRIVFPDSTYLTTASGGSGSGSSITQSGGNVGIGTTNPQATLDVAGVINGRNFTFPNTGDNPQWAQIGTFTAAQGGETVRVTAYLHAGFNAGNGQDSTYVLTFKTSNGQGGDSNGFYGNGSWYAIGDNGAVPAGDIKWVANAPGGNATAFTLYILLPQWTLGSHYAVTIDENAAWSNVGSLGASDPGAASSSVLIPSTEFNLPYGNVGIGTVSPGSKLEVNGNIAMTSGSAASIVFADGTQQSTAWRGVLSSALEFPDNTIQKTAWNGTTVGGDYAESIDVLGDRARYEPGDVIAIDDSESGKFVKVQGAYSKFVAGVFSTKPGLVGRRTTFATVDKDAEVPMAMMGIVPTKVSTENGPIQRGDLLVSSSTPGYAMRGTDRDRMTGAIIGKALAPLKAGSGVIEVLLALQ